MTRDEVLLEMWRRYHCIVLDGSVDLADTDKEAHARFVAGQRSCKDVYVMLSNALDVEPTALLTPARPDE